MSSWCWEGWRVCVDFANWFFAILQDPQRSGIASRVYHSIPGFSCQPLSNNTLAAIPMKRLDLAEARASVQADADAIKERIQKEHQSFWVCEPDGGASPVVWSHKILEAVSTRTWRDRTVNTNASRLGPFDQLSSHFSHTFCRLTVRSPMNYRQTADGCSLKIRQGSSAQFGSQQIDWTLSQSFLSHGP